MLNNFVETGYQNFNVLRGWEAACPEFIEGLEPILISGRLADNVIFTSNVGSCC